jgi:hypothetical protein
MNELDVEWVGEKSWTYRTFFSSPELLTGESVYLLFGGLDTFATVKLNDKVILTSDNMFLAHRVEVTSLLAPENNTLVIDFDSALLRGREIERQHEEHRYLAHNGESGRLGVRKAQYHWVCFCVRIESIALSILTSKCLGMGLGSRLDDCWTVEARLSGGVQRLHPRCLNHLCCSGRSELRVRNSQYRV